MKRMVIVQFAPHWSSSLRGMAQHFYGNPEDWSRIYNANRGKVMNPDVLYVGQRLVIP